MSLKGKQIFYRTPDKGFQYKWAPDTFSKDIRPRRLRIRTRKNCTATPGSQGEDFDTGYVYKLVINDVEHHYAYVACDFVM